MADESINQLIRDREHHDYTFHGQAVDEIRKALVLGLFLSCEVERVLGESAARIGAKIPPDLRPRIPDEYTTAQIANALFWIEMTGGVSRKTENAG